MSFWPPCCESEANFLNKVSSGLKCSHGKIFIPVAEISVSTGNRAGLPSHMNTSEFYEGHRSEARCQLPGQSGQPQAGYSEYT